MPVGGAMPPAGAGRMPVPLGAPAPGVTVTGNSVTVRAGGYTGTRALAGRHVTETEATATGHCHVILDGAAGRPGPHAGRRGLAAERQARRAHAPRGARAG
jgi:hypothetical protein